MSVYLGGKKVSIFAGAGAAKMQEKTVTPTENQQAVTPDTGYDGLTKVTVGAVSSTYIGSKVTKKSAQTYIPGTSDQTIGSGQYLSGTQTIKGDSNLVGSNIIRQVDFWSAWECGCTEVLYGQLHSEFFFRQ